MMILLANLTAVCSSQHMLMGQGSRRAFIGRRRRSVLKSNMSAVVGLLDEASYNVHFTYVLPFIYVVVRVKKCMLKFTVVVRVRIQNMAYVP
jgi:hypothetical protein